MQHCPLKAVICGRWKHCSKVIHRPCVCYCAVLSVVRKMSEATVHISVEQRIIVKFLKKEDCKLSEICSRLKRQYGEKTLSNVSVSKWSSTFKKGRETVENEPYERRPRTSITSKKSDRVDTLIRENRRITVRELSGIPNISDGSVKTFSKDNHQEQEKKAQTSLSILQDNACPHLAARTMDTIQKLKWNVLPHLPYSPDLAPSDYNLFGPLEEHLGGKRFRNNEELIQDVQEWLHWQPKNFFLSGIRKLPDRWRK